MARPRTANTKAYELKRASYLRRKRKDGKVLTDAEHAFLEDYDAKMRAQNPEPTVQPASEVPEPLYVPLDGTTMSEVPAESTSNTSPSSTAPSPSSVPKEPGSSTGPTASSAPSSSSTPKAKTDAGNQAQQEQAKGIGRVLVQYMRTCNDELKKHPGALVLPEQVFTALIEPCVDAVCMRHAEVMGMESETAQNIVVLGSGLATVGQLYYRNRKASSDEPPVSEASPIPESPPETVVVEQQPQTRSMQRRAFSASDFAKAFRQSS